MDKMKKFSKVTARYPAADPAAAQRLLDAELARDNHKVVVLDDDPTGVQTVHDVSVYTYGSADNVAAGFDEPSRMFFILTNSRSLNAENTNSLHTGIARQVTHAAGERNQPYFLVSRSDSTLRGHYPLETETLRKTIHLMEGRDTDMEIICPYFREGGRVTIEGIHYVLDGDRMVPAAQTEYAEDPVFGYESSDMRAWIEEKTDGRFPARSVTVLSLGALRAMDMEALVQELMPVTDFDKVVIDAVEDADVMVAAAAIMMAARRGKTFLFRSAASLVRVLGGVSKEPVMQPEDLLEGEDPGRVAGGLVVVGSYMNRSTEQLNQLIKTGYVTPVEMDVCAVLENRQGQMTDCLCEKISAMMAKGRSVALYTTRRYIAPKDSDRGDNLSFSLEVSSALVRVVSGLKIRPRFLVVKGGITSSDIGVHALGARRATVAGQAMPGVPVWRLGAESRFPGLNYVIFPGNVGDEDALKDLVLPLLWGHGRQLKDFEPDRIHMPESLPPIPEAGQEGWPSKRKELLDFFARNVYGVMPPAPENGVRVCVTSIRDVFGGKATHTAFDLSFETPDGRFSFPFHLVVPLHVTKPPVFLHVAWQQGIDGLYCPTEELVDSGFALASYCYEDIAPDKDDGFLGGLAGHYPLEDRTPETWGKIALWAYAAHRVMDALQQRTDIDTEQVAVVGHSRLGKTALWAGATDDRFAFVATNASGCGGTAITREKKGEHIRHLTGSFGHWLCANYRGFAAHEDSMPFDQHHLLACIAPRLLYNGSALQDEWSDPLAEYMGCIAAGEAWKRMGADGFEPAVLAPVADRGVYLVNHGGPIGYHLREGMHFFSRTDWRQIMHFWKSKLES